MKKRLSELDALRGIAALLVVVFHINATYPIANNNLVQGFVKFGITGVDLFFMISGFVILMTLEKTKSWKDFVLKRFARLYPTYWVCVSLTVLCAVIYLAVSHRSYAFILHQYLPNLTMFQQYFGVPNIDDVYWTMLIEMLFYGFMLFIFCIKKLKHIEWIAIIAMLPLFIYSSQYFRVHFPGYHHLLVTALPIINYFPMFVMGIIYYKMKFDRPTPLRYIALLLCILCQASLYGNGLNVDLFLSFKDHVLITVFYNLVFLLYVHDKLRFIVNKATLFIGNISYPLYLIHYYISVNVIIPALLGFNVPVLLASAIAFIVSIILATLISKFVEKPSIKFFRDKFHTADKLPALPPVSLP